MYVKYSIIDEFIKNKMEGNYIFYFDTSQKQLHANKKKQTLKKNLFTPTNTEMILQLGAKLILLDI